MVYLDVVPKYIISTVVKPVDVKVDVGKQFTNEQEFVVCNHMPQQIRTEAAKLGFSVVI